MSNGIMDMSADICNSLLKWLQNLELEKPVRSMEELCDGVVLAQALVQIAPNHFIRLSSSVHADVGSNFRLKVNNLRKIIKCLEEYYQDVLNLHLLDTAKPEIIKIGESSDYTEIGKLLRLILGCAVNCDTKQEYITRIMSLEESVQQNIMQAIQQLEEVTNGRGRSSLSLLGLESDAKYQRLIVDLEAACETKDLLSQKCHNLETQVTCLTDEKFSLSAENSRLVNKLKEFESLFGRDDQVSDGAVSRSTEFRRQIESLKEDLYKTETQRDDYRIKVLELEKDVQVLQEKTIDLQAVADRAALLKDEVDALTETADKAKALEMTLTSYKKKFEEYTDLKKKYKMLQDENNEYYQQNLKYQEEMKRNNLYKSQSEVYKKQVEDLHQKIDEEIQKTDRFTFENKKLESKLLMFLREKESLIEERDGLKEMNEELRCRSADKTDQTAVANELAPTEYQTRIKRLEAENQTLRHQTEEAVAKKLLLDDVQLRLDKMLDQNRASHQRILELDAQLNEQNDTNKADPNELTIYKNKCVTLQEMLAKQETELQLAIEKYHKCLEKARTIIKQFDMEQATPALHKASLKQEQMTDREERLIVSCFHKLSMTCQRDAVDERLASLTMGQSFMSRQRQPMPRKQIPPYKSK